MKSLPPQAATYLVAISVCGSLCLVYAPFLMHADKHAVLWQTAVFLVLGVFAGRMKLHLVRNSKENESGSITLGFAISLAALIQCGPGAAIVVSAATCLAGCIFPELQELHQIIFNVALGCLEAGGGGLVYVLLNKLIIGSPDMREFGAVTGAATTFFLVNTVGVAQIIALCQKQKLKKIWLSNFLWMAPGYVAAACVTAFATLLFTSNFSAVLLFVVPVIFLVYQFYVGHVERVEEKEKYIEDIQLSEEHLAELYLQTIKSLALAIDAKDRYTHQHILRVQRYSVAIAKQMGLTGSDLEAVNTGALLHDIGKLGVPEYVLMKPGRLTPEEFDKIKQHPEIGAAILDPVEFPWPVLPVVRHHHEKWDGTGYPDRLKGEEIPLNARIMAVADVYDALTSSRSYRQAWTHERAVATITKDVGTHFDAVVVEAFLKVIDDVVQQMALDGEGPLVPRTTRAAEPEDKTAAAAKAISRTSAELWALYEVAQTMASSVGTREVVEYLARKLEKTFPGALCVVFTKAPNAEKLECAAASGINREFFCSASTINPKSLSWQTMIAGTPYVGEYDVDDLMLASVEGTQWEVLQSSVIVPIVCGGEALGTLNLYHCEANAFSEHDRDLLGFVAERCGPAFQHSFLDDQPLSDTERDSMTEAFNLVYLTREIELLLDPESRTTRFALICLNLDTFKSINELFGRTKGNEILGQVAQILMSAIDQDDIVARLGGDEFLILLKDAGHGEADQYLGRVEEQFNQYDPSLLHHALGELAVQYTTGIACYPDSARDCAGLIANADAEMRRAKSERKLRPLSRSSRSRKKAA